MDGSAVPGVVEGPGSSGFAADALGQPRSPHARRLGQLALDVLREASALPAALELPIRRLAVVFRVHPYVLWVCLLAIFLSGVIATSWIVTAFLLVATRLGRRGFGASAKDGEDEEPASPGADVGGDPLGSRATEIGGGGSAASNASRPLPRGAATPPPLPPGLGLTAADQQHVTALVVYCQTKIPSNAAEVARLVGEIFGLPLGAAQLALLLGPGPGRVDEAALGLDELRNNIQKLLYLDRSAGPAPGAVHDKAAAYTDPAVLLKVSQRLRLAHLLRSPLAGGPQPGPRLGGSSGGSAAVAVAGPGAPQPQRQPSPEDALLALLALVWAAWVADHGERLGKAHPVQLVPQGAAEAGQHDDEPREAGGGAGATGAAAGRDQDGGRAWRASVFLVHLIRALKLA